MAFNFLRQPNTTASEYVAAVGRITQGALDGLTLTHLPTIAAGSFGLFSIGLAESRLWLRPPFPDSTGHTSLYHRCSFCVRYGIANLIPSLIPETVPAPLLAKRAGLDPKSVYSSAEIMQHEQPGRYLRFVRSVSFRCALAGSILLSQIISLVTIIMDAQEDYVERIRQGKEPPLDVQVAANSWRCWTPWTRNEHSDLAAALNTGRIPGLGQQGVVVRLAGEASDVTMQSLSLEGRRRIFPIFENSERSGVKTLVREFGSSGRLVGSDPTGSPLLPVYWKVPNGRYGRADSWRDLKLPAQWLSDVTTTVSRVHSRRPTKVLLLEADATCGNSASISLQRMSSSDLDLDFCEIEQGFHNLVGCVDAPPGSFDVMRVLLVDPEVEVNMGGDFTQPADKYVREMGLADIVIDARRPLTYAMCKWLESVDNDDDCDSKGTAGREKILTRAGRKLAQFAGRKWLRPVILWTQNDEWFQSIRSELIPLGYDVICYAEALRRHGRDGAEHLPMFVYENRISDSVHTCRRLVEKGRTCEDTVCALFPQHFNKSRGEDEHCYASICSTSLYNRLFYWTRDRILQGWTTEEIQNKLDNDLGGVLSEAKLPFAHDIGEEALIALLNEACSQGDVEEVENLIQQGADPHAGDYDGRRPVHLAAASGQVPVLEYLYNNHNVDLHCMDRLGNNPIADAVRNNKISTIRWLRKRGAMLDESDSIEYDILDFCCKGDFTKLKRYVEAGCNINIFDYDGRSPLMIAASFSHSEAVRVLLLAGSDTESRDRWGQTAMDAAQMAKSMQCMDLIRDSKRLHLHLREKDSAERSHATDSSASRESLKFMQQPRTPSFIVNDIFSAAQQGDVNELKRLVAKGGVQCCADAEDYDARTPLHIAAAGGRLEAVKYLCSLPDVNLNAMDRWHHTPMYEANKNGFSDVSSYLREQGATTTTHGSVGHALCKAAAEGNISKLEEIEKVGADLNDADYDGRTAAHLAASNGHLQAIKWLMSRGALVDVTDRFNNTPLDDAIRENQSDIVQLLETESQR